jgi:hypothetical protein
MNASREAGLRIFYALHHRYRPGDYETWKYIPLIQKAAWRSKVFEYGTWGGEIRAEFAPQQGWLATDCHFATLRLRSTGVPAGFAIPTWICNLKSMAFISLSSSGS